MVDAGSVIINDGQFNVSVQRNTAYGIYLRKALQVKDNIAVPQALIRGGKFMITGSSTLRPVNTYAAPDALTLEGGLFNRSTSLSRYTAPTKDCNYQLVKLSKKEEAYLDGYRYKIVEIPVETIVEAHVRKTEGSWKEYSGITLQDDEWTDSPIRVYDTSGRLVLTVQAGEAGNLRLTSGIYILQAGDKSRKILVP